MKNFYSYKVVFSDGSSDGGRVKLWSETKGTEYEFDTFHLEEFNTFLVSIVKSHEEQYPEHIIVTIESISLIHQETQPERTIHRYSSMLEEVKALCDIAELSDNSLNIRRQVFYDKMMKWSKEYHLKRRVV